ncbi:MAG: LysR family transcriptional regulator [Pseudomonadota bacterium]
MQKLDNLLMSRQLAHFVAIADAGSLNKAADKLGIAQSALTRSVRQLEDRVGSRLFQRGPRGSTLTAEGQLFLDYTQRVRRETDLAMLAISHVTEREKPLIRVGTTPAFGLSVLPEAIAAFRAKHPGFRIQIRQAAPVGLMNLLVRSEVDFFVGPTANERPAADIEIVQIANIPSSVFARKGHPLAQQDSVAFTDLLKFDWVSLADDDHRLLPENWLDKLSRLAYENGLTAPEISLETNSVVNALNLTSNSDCLLSLSSMLQSEAALRGLTSLNLPVPLTEHANGIACGSPITRDPYVAEFMRIIKDSVPHGFVAN